MAAVTHMKNVSHMLESCIRNNVNMKDVRHMYTYNVTDSGLQNIVMIFQIIFQFYVEIMMLIIWDGLDLEKVKSLGHKMELFHFNPGN